MESWSSFYLFVFWLSLSVFCVKNNNILNLILYSEIVWVVIYTVCVVLGVQVDDLNLVSLTFLSLGLAGLEFSLGILLVVFYNNNINSIYIHN